MNPIASRIDLLGRRESANLPTATTQRLFASLSAGDPPRRKAISFTNVDLVAELYVALAPSGAAAPTLSTTDHDLVVPPRSSRQFQVGPGIDLWVRSSSAGTVAYTALELI